MVQVRASWAEFDAHAQAGASSGSDQQVGARVQIGFAEFDAAAPAIAVQIGFAEFDTRATASSVVVSFAEFDALVPAAEAPGGGGGSRPPNRYNPGIPLSRYYDDAEKKFTIPLDADADEEEEIILTILMEVAAYVL